MFVHKALDLRMKTKSPITTNSSIQTRIQCRFQLTNIAIWFNNGFTPSFIRGFMYLVISNFIWTFQRIVNFHDFQVIMSHHIDEWKWSCSCLLLQLISITFHRSVRRNEVKCKKMFLFLRTQSALLDLKSKHPSLKVHLYVIELALLHPLPWGNHAILGLFSAQTIDFMPLTNANFCPLVPKSKCYYYY